VGVESRDVIVVVLLGWRERELPVIRIMSPWLGLGPRGFGATEPDSSLVESASSVRKLWGESLLSPPDSRTNFRRFVLGCFNVYRFDMVRLCS
jgi:hypothetical protein